MSNALSEYLSKFSEAEWLVAVDELLPCVHDVDKQAVQVWFRFFPLDLVRFASEVEDREELIRGLALQGDFELRNQIDTSHHFLYGHRFWPKVKCVIGKMLSDRDAGGKVSPVSSSEFRVPRRMKPKPGDRHSELEVGPPADAGRSERSELADIVKEVGMRVAEKLNVDRKLTNAIAAVGLATLNQVGAEAFKAAEGKAGELFSNKSPEAIVAERAKDDSQGLFGFFENDRQKFSISFAADNYHGKFPVMDDQQMTLAAAADRSQNWQSKDERCWEGPIPVECTSASCGTCWIGVIGGQDKLTEVGRRERRAMQVFGYNQPDNEKPFLRLACQTKASGNVSIVIPPWNGVFGKKVRGNVEEIELEPNTTSAKTLRETIAGAAGT